ncbi:MAG: hypothetical protein NC223_03570 [Butyrivibrio sp.]|nr:hypothetical protein [Butyrivibrio sp.]
MGIFWLRKFRKNRRRLNTGKGDNRGASMVAALVAIAFVAILASVVMTSTVTNYKLKTMNYKSKKTFYSAESALEEIHAGLSTECYKSLKEKYLDAITKLPSYGDVSSTEANEKANKEFKKSYLTAIYDKLDLASLDTLNGGLKGYLTGFLTDTTNASVVSVGALTANSSLGAGGEIDSITINDLVVQYKESATDYFSTVAVDLVMEFPDVKFDFINDRNTLKTYLDYCLIGMKGIEAGNNSTSSIAGGAFAGNVGGMGGLTVDGGSRLDFVEGLCSTVLVSAGDINVKGTVNVDNGKIWGVNINVGDRLTSKGGVLKFAEGSDTYAYVQDDLNFIGSGSSVEMGGSFYGFGYSDNTMGNSSAIVINGEKSSLDISHLNRMLLGGRAYINVGSNGYMTGDSIGLKGSQEVYLVPTAYMNCSNPYAVSDHVGDSSFVPVDLTALEDFFAYSLLASTPYEVIEVDGTAYVYLKFKDSAAQIQYVTAIVNGNNIDDSDSFDTDISVLRRILNRSASKFTDGNLEFWGGGSLSSSDVLSGGSLYQVVENSLGVNSSVLGIGSDTFIQACQDKAKRYSLLKLYLHDIGSESGAGFSTDSFDAGTANGDVVIIDDIPYIINNAVSIYDYVVDTALLEEFRISVEEETVKYVREDYSYAAAGGSAYSAVAVVAAGGAYEIPDDAFYGVILGYDCDITVDHDFEGLIITNGKINITNGAKLRANHDLSDDVIENNPVLAQYFKAYQNSANSNQVDPGDITKGDLLGINNWRKNYVSEETSAE